MKGLQPRIILHVGLHKTGTTYLQKRVFTQFDKSSVVYNPEKLRKSIRELYGLKLKTELLSKYQEIVKSEIIKIDKEILFLSHEIYSGTPWTNYDDIEIMTDFLSQAFPTAEIILVFREHADWLESLYRESAKDGNLVSMNRFLNYKRGCFSSRSLTPYKNVNALDFQYDLIENLFHRKFHKIHLLFFEELRDKPENFFAKLEQITKSKLRLVKQVKENRSYSALTIKILLFIAHIPLLRLMFISNQNSLLNSFMLLTKKYDQSVGSLNLALKTGKFITIPIVLFRRVLLKMGFGIEEKSLRKKRTMRLRRFVDKFEKYIYYDWTMMSKKKQELIRKHYKNDYFFVRNM